MTITTGFGGTEQKSDYEVYKEKMWDAFRGFKAVKRLSILIDESWPFLIFLLGYVVLPVVSAHAQARSGQGNHPAIAAIIYVTLVVILVACVLFLLFSNARWGNVHSWAAKTATFLLGFLTKSAQEFL